MLMSAVLEPIGLRALLGTLVNDTALVYDTVLVYIRTLQGWFLSSRPKIILFAFIFCLLCNGAKRDC